MGEILHPTKPVLIDGQEALIDEELVPVVEHLNNVLHRPTTAACQNYGEYLRFMDLDFVRESTRDYGYLEFADLDTAMSLIHLLQENVPHIDMLYMKLVQPDTPDAWEVKVHLGFEKIWVMFPASDIPQFTEVVLGLG